jgi:zinc transporter ZupT
MDKKKSMNKLIKSVTLFLSIRRGFKIYVAFVTGILSGIAIFGDIYDITENSLYSAALSVLLGAFITAVMLLIMELIRTVIKNARTVGTKQLEKYKERKSADEKEK